ncbi:MAG: hypothetical protein NTU62_11655 [Spirochaetes bacterium]|nr:hypothetical protein [Spirochaetota bacterium]
MYAAGDILLWRRFPHPRDPASEKKDRYLAFLGYSSRLSPPIIAYLCTTTTKLEHYKPGAPRARNAFHSFREGDCGLPKECVLDLDFNFYADISEEELAGNVADIEKIGSIPKDTLRHIWNLIRQCRGIPLVVKKDIHFALNSVDLIGLKQPERR